MFTRPPSHPYHHPDSTHRFRSLTNIKPMSTRNAATNLMFTFTRISSPSIFKSTDNMRLSLTKLHLRHTPLTVAALLSRRHPLLLLTRIKLSARLRLTTPNFQFNSRSHLKNSHNDKNSKIAQNTNQSHSRPITNNSHRHMNRPILRTNSNTPNADNGTTLPAKHNNNHMANSQNITVVTQ